MYAHEFINKLQQQQQQRHTLRQIGISLNLTQILRFGSYNSEMLISTEGAVSQYQTSMGSNSILTMFMRTRTKENKLKQRENFEAKQERIKKKITKA